MKYIIIICTITTILLTACNNSSTTTTKATDNIVAPPVAPPAGVDVNGNMQVTVKGILEHYLHLKNALAADNSKDAATAGNDLLAVMMKVDQSAMTAGQKKKYADLADDMKEHAAHIGANGGKIAHQRAHFEMLSTDVYDLVKAFGGGQPLYKDFCPMANEKVGASWVSETKEIKNPYMGKAMSTCGSVKEEIK